MSDFLNAIRTLGVSDFLRLVAILTPFVAAIWAAIHWGYRTRIDSLASSLKLHQDDGQLRLSRELETATSPLILRIAELTSALEAATTKLTTGVEREALAIKHLKWLYELSEVSAQYPEEFQALQRLIGDHYFPPPPPPPKRSMREVMMDESSPELEALLEAQKDRRPEYVRLFHRRK